MNTYLKIALLCVSFVAVGLLVLNLRTQAKAEHLKPLVIRIDDIGRAQAVQYDTLTYHPRGPAPELKYFLTQFVTKHFARMRATVKERYAESLYFLDAAIRERGLEGTDARRGVGMGIPQVTCPSTSRMGRQTRIDRSRPIERGCGSIPARGVGVRGRKLLTTRRRVVVSRVGIEPTTRRLRVFV
ncbi:MAG: hypothetical protein ABJA98_12545 [Acidobacteriota bacterium]